MNKDTKIIWKPIDELIPYEHNAKEHTEKQLANLEESFRRYGWQQPCLITNDNVIITGHGRALGAKRAGLTDAPCIYCDDLSEKEIKEYRHLDNLLSDGDYIQAELEFELPELDFSGFDLDFDIDLSIDEPNEIIEDEAPEVNEEAEPICKLGDIWQLGNHRLICGDSTDKAVIDRLMDGVKADMVFTDPPYGVDYDGGVIHGSKINKEHKRQRLKNDDNDIYSEFIPILNRIIDNGAIYIFYATRNSYEILKPLKENDIEVHSIIAWNKINAGYADMNSHYKNKYEPCVYACRKGYSLNWNGGTTENTVWDIEKDRDNKLHPTQKPIELPTRAIRNSSRKGDIVVDLFGGSGSTLIACEQLNRKCLMCELDPKYCDVIIQRWENFTGEKAVLIDE